MSVLARVLGKFLSDQEHDFLVGWLLNKCCLHAFKQNGYVIYGLVLKKYDEKYFILCSWEVWIKLSWFCDLCFENVLIVQLSDFENKRMDHMLLKWKKIGN